MGLLPMAFAYPRLRSNPYAAPNEIIRCQQFTQLGETTFEVGLMHV
jgi:hypothetical protein